LIQYTDQPVAALTVALLFAFCASALMSLKLKH
jgi:hypothetical protein